MNPQNNLIPAHSGILVTNSDGIIQTCNSNALRLLNTDFVLGRHISAFQELITKMGVRTDYLENEIIYLFAENNIESRFETLFKQFDFGVFTTDIEGQLFFKNDYFNSLFEFSTGNIFSIFKSNNVNISSFNVVRRAKKEVVYEIQLLDSNKYTLKLIPSLNEGNELAIIYGFISRASNVAELENKIAKLQLELDHYKANQGQISAKTLEKPNLQLHSKPMKEIYSILSNILNKDITILLLGQSGTGKSSLARSIHSACIRASKPFVTINCSALSENLIESELFGYSKGAFTGALASGKKGLVEIADGGTLFIDEIGEIPLYLQGKLLELIQEKTYRPVGSVENKVANVRIIVATNKDLASLVQQKKFREDLYYRVAVAVINIPPLSTHPEDIKTLLDAYTLYFNKKYDLNVQFSQDSKKILINYNWPGNIRELEHIVEFLIVRSNKSTVEKHDIPLDIISHYEKNNSEYDFLVKRNHKIADGEQINSKLLLNIDIDNKDLNLKNHMENCESIIINEYYKIYCNSYKLAKHLDISQTKANRLIHKYCK